MKRIIFVFVVSILCVLPFFSVEPAPSQLIKSGHWVYDALTMLSYETGRTSFATAAPLSIAELQLYLSQIPYETLSVSGQKLYRNIEDFFHSSYPGFSSDYISIGIEPSLNPSFFIKSNTDAPWLYEYADREPFVLMPLLISVADVVTIDADLFVGQNYWTSVRNDIFSNIPLSGDAVDVSFPQRSYISVAGSFFNFQLGMDALDLGKTQTGGLLFSDHMIGASYAQISFFSPRVRFTSTPIELEVNKYLYMHRLDLRPFEWLSIGFIEGVLVSQPFELRFLNPVMIFHGFAAWRDYTDDEGKPSDDSNVGSYWGVTVDVAPFKYTRIYGEFAMNQYQLPYEKEHWPEASLSIPDSIAFLAGAQWWYPVGGYSDMAGYIYAGIEGVYTSPWMYILADKRWSFYREHFEFVSPETGKAIRNWVGTPFGPDSIAVQLQTGYSVPLLWSVQLRYLFWAKGENEEKVFKKIDAGEPYYPKNGDEAQIQAPSGNPLYTHKLIVSGSYNFASRLSFGMQGGLLWRYGRIPFQFSTECALYATIKLY